MLCNIVMREMIRFRLYWFAKNVPCIRHRRMKGRWGKIFKNYFCIARSPIYMHWATKAVIYLGDTRVCSHGIFWKHCVIWRILKCILIKFQGKNSLKISVFIATTTKKSCEFVRGVRRHALLSAKTLEKWCSLVHFKGYFN